MTGAGTTHHTNGIMFQVQESDSATEVPQQPFAEPPVGRQRSFVPVTSDIAPYFLIKRKGPQNLNEPQLSLTESQKVVDEKSRSKDFCYIAIKSGASEHVQLSGWTTFNASITPPLPKSVIHYLPVIEASPTSLSTVKHILESAVKMADTLECESLMIIFDQAMYSKAQQINGQIQCLRSAWCPD